jgi:hypothetical protein
LNKNDLITFLDNVLEKYNFVKKGAQWTYETEDLIKIIKIQKSKFSNLFYLNYGYILKCLDVSDLEMHIYNRLSSVDDIENEKIRNLLDMEYKITDEKRKLELNYHLENNVLKHFLNTNSESDLLRKLQERPHLNDVPLIVKKHFKLI